VGNGSYHNVLFKDRNKRFGEIGAKEYLISRKFSRQLRELEQGV
jgi:hypothetical protein